MKTNKTITLIKQRVLRIGAFVTAIVALGLNSTAQDSRWNVTLRGSADFPTEKFSGVTLEPGFGGDLTAGYRLFQYCAVYAGWGWHRFHADNSFAGADVDVEETGYNAGLRYTQPIFKSDFLLIVGLGATYKHIETENNNGDIVADTDHGFGWESELGLGYPLLKCIDVSLFARYRSLTRDLHPGPENTHLNYLSGGLGLTWRF